MLTVLERTEDMVVIYDNKNPDGERTPTCHAYEDETEPMRTCKVCGHAKPVADFPKTGRNAKECADCRKMREDKARAGRKAKQNPNTRPRLANAAAYKPADKTVEKPADSMPELAQVVAQAIKAGLQVEVTIHG